MCKTHNWNPRQKQENEVKVISEEIKQVFCPRSPEKESRKIHENKPTWTFCIQTAEFLNNFTYEIMD